MEQKIGKSANHLADQQLGGGPRRSSSLRLIADEAGFVPVNTVPKTRAQCPDTSAAPCPHWRCRAHLYRVDACDRAGRPSLGSVPRGEKGRTLSATGVLGGQRAPTTLDPGGWIGPTPRPSCAYELADEAARRGRGMSNSEIGAAMGGRHRTLVARIATNALRSYIKAGGTLEGLRELAAQSEAAQANRSTSDTPLLDRIQRLIPDNERNQENEP